MPLTSSVKLKSANRPFTCASLYGWLQRPVSMDCKVVPSPLLSSGDRNRLLLVERGRLRPGHTFALCEYSTVLLDVVRGVFFQCLHEIINRPHVAFERAIQNALQHTRNLPIRDGVAGEIDNLIAHARFEEHDLRCQRTDVVRCRERHAVL